MRAVLANLDTPRFTVVDARAPDRFRGENEVVDPVGGHIPGAINRFFKDNLTADGRFKTPAQLKAEWTGAGHRAFARRDAVRVGGDGVSQPAGAGGGGFERRGAVSGVVE